MQLVSAATDGENHAIIPHLGFGLNVDDRFDSQRIDEVDVAAINPVAVPLKQQRATTGLDMARQRRTFHRPLYIDIDSSLHIR